MPRPTAQPPTGPHPTYEVSCTTCDKPCPWMVCKSNEHGNRGHWQVICFDVGQDGTKCNFVHFRSPRSSLALVAHTHTCSCHLIDHIGDPNGTEGLVLEDDPGQPLCDLGANKSHIPTSIELQLAETSKHEEEQCQHCADEIEVQNCAQYHTVVYSWVKDGGQPNVFEFQSGTLSFTWPHLSLNHQVISLMGLAAARVNEGPDYLITVVEGQLVLLKNPNLHHTQDDAKMSASPSELEVEALLLSKGKGKAKPLSEALPSPPPAKPHSRQPSLSYSAYSVPSFWTPSPPTKPSKQNIRHHSPCSPTTSDSSPPHTRRKPIEWATACPLVWPGDFYACDIAKGFRLCETISKHCQGVTKVFQKMFGVPYASTTFHAHKRHRVDVPANITDRFVKAG
ncbi:hypothetical protein BDR06DRAFT_973908 [Suillus hirtellus]|nr:hypothetical protein BDR06DRAFT_973908 [Suillus hirtellus]